MKLQILRRVRPNQRVPYLAGPTLIDSEIGRPACEILVTGARRENGSGRRQKDDPTLSQLILARAQGAQE